MWITNGWLVALVALHHLRIRSRLTALFKWAFLGKSSAAAFVRLAVNCFTIVPLALIRMMIILSSIVITDILCKYVWFCYWLLLFSGPSDLCRQPAHEPRPFWRVQWLTGVASLGACSPQNLCRLLAWLAGARVWGGWGKSQVRIWLFIVAWSLVWTVHQCADFSQRGLHVLHAWWSFCRLSKNSGTSIWFHQFSLKMHQQGWILPGFGQKCTIFDKTISLSLSLSLSSNSLIHCYATVATWLPMKDFIQLYMFTNCRCMHVKTKKAGYRRRCAKSCSL